MIFTLSDPEVSDAEHITRNIHVPASSRGPLFQIMWPTWDNLPETEREQILRWSISSLTEALEDRWESFLKVNVADTAVGFCAWTIIDRTKSVDSSKPLSKTEKGKRDSPPEALDVDAWIAVSKALRDERERILKNKDNICRTGITIMDVTPEYQRHGIGSSMMQQICDETDLQGRAAYVLAAPEGVALYSKFGFEIVGQVETPYGAIKSMFRPARTTHELEAESQPFSELKCLFIKRSIV